MGKSKIDFFTEAQNDLAIVFKALGHPARIAIVEYLLNVDACVCGDIVDELPLAQATVSQHLKELKQAGIVQGNIEGKNSCYCLNPEFVTIIESFIQKINIEAKICC
jgi:DNA-binding transcriptional ArsR family regulator